MCTACHKAAGRDYVSRLRPRAQAPTSGRQQHHTLSRRVRWEWAFRKISNFSCGGGAGPNTSAVPLGPG
jgi:hypothetical protein